MVKAAQVFLASVALGALCLTTDALARGGGGGHFGGGHFGGVSRFGATHFGGGHANLPRSTLIYPGHDYMESNLRFTLNREPDNKSARKMLDKLAGQDPNSAYISTLDVEAEINTFFRLTSPMVIAKLRESFPELPEKPDQRTVFLKLRELRNSW